MNNWTIVEETDALVIASIVAVLFGDPGMGKTSLAMQSENSILFDFDDGLKRSVKRKRAVQMRFYQSALDFLNSEQFQSMNIKTVILDTGGTLLDNYMAHHLIEADTANKKKGGGLSLGGYGALKEEFNRFINDLKRRGLDIIVICHTEQYKDGENLRFRPKMTGGSYDILMQVADIVGFMESKGDKRTLDFNPKDRHIGKNAPRFAAFNVPNFDDIAFENFMGNILTQTKDKMSKLDEEQQNALNLLEEKRQEIEKADTYESLTELETTFDALKPAFKIQLLKITSDKKTEIVKGYIAQTNEVLEFQVMLQTIVDKYDDNKMYKKLLFDKMKEKGLDFNKDKREFFVPEATDDNANNGASTGTKTEEKTEVKDEVATPVVETKTEEVKPVVEDKKTTAAAKKAEKVDKDKVVEQPTELFKDND